MKNTRLFGMLTATALFLGLSAALTACGASTATGDASNGSATLSGAILGDAASAGSVQLQDASSRKLVAAVDAQQGFAFDVGGLTGPFTLRAALTNGKVLGAIAPGPGVVSLDSLSAVAFEASDDSGHTPDSGEAADGARQSRFAALLAQLRTVLAPLFECFGIGATTGPRDPAWKALFAAVRFEIDDGVVTVTNRQSGAVIFSARANALAQGTYTAASLPAQCTGTPAPVACTTLTYSAWGTCQANGTQTRTVTSALPAGCDQSAAVLTRSCTPTATACTSWTYSPWGTCQANGTQARTATGVPTGCTGTPDQPTTQACTPTATAPVLSAVSVSPMSVTGGASATGTVTLSAAAPTGGLAVTLSSSSASATVPASVTVAAGATSATFTVSTIAVASATTATLTAASGGVTLTTSLTVNAPAALVCTSCHGANGPTTGQHTFHVVTQGFACSRCHGTGYDFAARTVNTATHQNGVVDVVVSNWNATAKTCGGCHAAGSRTW